jgi:hypothetical protein
MWKIRSLWFLRFSLFLCVAFRGEIFCHAPYFLTYEAARSYGAASSLRTATAASFCAFALPLLSPASLLSFAIFYATAPTST